MRSLQLKNIKAIIFDFDGVIFDTEPLWFLSAISSLKKLKLEYNKKITYKDTIGVDSNIVFEKLLNNKKNYILNKKKINFVYKNELKYNFSKKIKPFPYLKIFFKKINLKKAIVSNSSKSHIINLLTQSNLLKYFNSNNIISCGKYIKSKPEPDGYNLGIRRLGLKPSNILVIEDSEIGITSAKKAKISNILRFTNNNLNLSSKIIHNDVCSFRSFKDLMIYFNNFN